MRNLMQCLLVGKRNPYMIDNASELATSGTITTSPEGTRRGREMELRERGRVERRG